MNVRNMEMLSSELAKKRYRIIYRDKKQWKMSGMKLGVGNYGLFFFYLAQVVRNNVFLKNVHQGLFFDSSIPVVIPKIKC